MDSCLNIDYSYAKALQDLLFKITLKHAAPNGIQAEFDIIFNEFKYDQHRQKAFYLSFYDYLEKNWSGAELDLLKSSIRPSDKQPPIVSYSEESHKLLLGEMSSPKPSQPSKSKDKGVSFLSNWSIFHCCCFKGDNNADDTKTPLISVDEDKKYRTFELG